MHHLQAVVRHVAGEVLVNLHHGTAEVFAIAAHGEFGAGIGRPFGKGFGQLLVIPREEKVAEFVVVDRVGIGRVGDPEVAGFAEVAGVGRSNLLTDRSESLLVRSEHLAMQFQA